MYYIEIRYEHNLFIPKKFGLFGSADAAYKLLNGLGLEPSYDGCSFTGRIKEFDVTAHILPISMIIQSPDRLEQMVSGK